MIDFTTDRALFACNALVYLAIGLGALAFWSEAIAAGELLDYLVAAILTAACTMVSFLLSGVVIRMAEAREAKAWLTLAGVIAFGLVLWAIEGGMSLHGLAWLDERRDIGSPEALLLASFGLSAFNVGGLYFFAREIRRPRTLATASAEAAVFGQAQAALPAPAPESGAPLTPAQMKDPELAKMVQAVEGLAARRRLNLH